LAVAIIVAGRPYALAQERKDEATDPIVTAAAPEVAGSDKVEQAPETVRLLTIPAASFSNTFEQSNQAPGRVVFRPSAGHFTADRPTGAYAKEGFSLERSGLKIVNVRLHAKDNSDSNALVQVYGIGKGTTAVTEVATFFTSERSAEVRTFDFDVSHVYQGLRYYTVSIWVPDSSVDIYGVEIWYQEENAPRRN